MPAQQLAEVADPGPEIHHELVLVLTRQSRPLVEEPELPQEPFPPGVLDLERLKQGVRGMAAFHGIGQSRYTPAAVPNCPHRGERLMRHWRAAFAALVILIGSALPAAAAEGAPSDDLPVPPDVSFSVGTRAWWTSGYSEWSHSFQGINPLSELRWRGVDALIPEVNADFAWKRLVLRAAAGWGKSENGVLIDEDFLLDDHNGRFSVTRSSVESEIFYANGDVGIRVFRWVSTDGRLGFFDFLGGYQYWREEYEAFGLTGSGTAPGSTNVLSEKFTWQSLRIGARYQIPFPKGFGFKAEAMFIPWSRFELEDIHRLRTDLRQDPSFRAKADGGFGFQVEGAISYTIWKGLSIEGGFRYTKMDSGDGDIDVRRVSGTQRVKFEGGKTERYGPFVGLQYRF